MEHYKRALELNESFEVPNFPALYKNIALGLIKSQEPAKIFAKTQIYRKVYEELSALLKLLLEQISKIIGDIFDKKYAKDISTTFTFLKNAKIGLERLNAMQTVGDTVGA